MPTIRQYVDNGTSGDINPISVTASSALVGDTILAVFADNFFTLGDIANPGGTAVTSFGSPVFTLDGGTNDNHVKVWVGTVTTAGGTVTVNQTDNGDERVLLLWVLQGTATYDGAAGTDSDTTSTSHVAPSVTPISGATDDLLVCVFGTPSGGNINYTLPGSLNPRTEWDLGAVSTYRGGEETLASSGPTGTRTATASAAVAWFGVSILMSSGSASPPPILPARPGLTWRRRFKHRQILPFAPPAATPVQQDGPHYQTTQYGGFF